MDSNMEKESSILLMAQKYKPHGLPIISKAKVKFIIKMEIILKVFSITLPSKELESIAGVTQQNIGAASKKIAWKEKLKLSLIKTNIMKGTFQEEKDKGKDIIDIAMETSSEEYGKMMKNILEFMSIALEALLKADLKMERCLKE